MHYNIMHYIYYILCIIYIKRKTFNFCIEIDVFNFR